MWELCKAIALETEFIQWMESRDGFRCFLTVFSNDDVMMCRERAWFVLAPTFQER